jgi:hypothetical protein
MLMRGGSLNADSIMAVTLVNPARTVLSLRDSLQLTEPQIVRIGEIADTLDQKLAVRRQVVAPIIADLTRATQDMQVGGMPNPAVFGQLQGTVTPQLEGARRESQDAMRQVQETLTEDQRARLPADLRAGGSGGSGRGGRQGGGTAGNFNAVGLIDRMLANPLPVLLDMRDTLAMSPEQVRRIEAVSSDLQTRLNTRRGELGRRFDNARAGQQGQLFAEMQPEIDRTRREITDALGQVERILTPQQWQQVPAEIRDPFRQQAPPARRGG